MACTFPQWVCFCKHAISVVGSSLCTSCADFQRGGRGIGEVHDVLGMRVVVCAAPGRSPCTADKERACLHVGKLITATWPSDAARRKDYISTPKANSYQSLHMAVRIPSSVDVPADGALLDEAACGAAADPVSTVEVQIRSDDMHAAAESGASSHFSYKGGLSAAQTQRLQDWTAQLMQVRSAATAALPSLTQYRGASRRRLLCTRSLPRLVPVERLCSMRMIG
jgi:ppGpp synthetase/RelA/SpoT-type nucleotidyltranferase